MIFLAKREVNAKVMKLQCHLMFSQPILTYVSEGKGMQSGRCTPTASAKYNLC